MQSTASASTSSSHQFTQVTIDARNVLREMEAAERARTVHAVPAPTLNKLPVWPAPAATTSDAHQVTHSASTVTDDEEDAAFMSALASTRAALDDALGKIKQAYAVDTVTNAAQVHASPAEVRVGYKSLLPPISVLSIPQVMMDPRDIARDAVRASRTPRPPASS